MLNVLCIDISANDLFTKGIYGYYIMLKFIIAKEILILTTCLVCSESFTLATIQEIKNCFNNCY